MGPIEIAELLVSGSILAVFFFVGMAIGFVIGILKKRKEKDSQFTGI